MGSFVVKQPDGKYAVFSTIVDDYTCIDCDTPEQAIGELAAAGNARPGYGIIPWAGVTYHSEDPKGELWSECELCRRIAHGLRTTSAGDAG